jgi:hypothetical protein
MYFKRRPHLAWFEKNVFKTPLLHPQLIILNSADNLLIIIKGLHHNHQKRRKLIINIINNFAQQRNITIETAANVARRKMLPAQQVFASSCRV